MTGSRPLEKLAHSRSDSVPLSNSNLESQSELTYPSDQDRSDSDQTGAEIARLRAEVEWLKEKYVGLANESPPSYFDNGESSDSESGRIQLRDEASGPSQ